MLRGTTEELIEWCYYVYIDQFNLRHAFIRFQFPKQI